MSDDRNGDAGRPSALTERLTGAQAVARVIASHETPVVYGIPGGHTMQIYDALFPMQNRVATYLVRQESVATVMAEVHGRLTRKPAFVIGQGAWVLGNASVGIMEAHLGSSPMVLLVDATDGGGFSHHGPYQTGSGGYGAYDLTGALKEITKRTFVANDPSQALQMTQLAIKHATTGEPGPVAVVLHSRALFQRIEPSSQPPSFLGRAPEIEPPFASGAAIDRAAQLIQAAHRPVIISGNGVRLAAAQSALHRCAHAIGAPVATTPAGKGTFPENDDLAVGVIGSFGHDTANTAVGDADLIIAVGTKLGASDTANANKDLIDVDRQQLIHVDVEPLNLSWTMPSDVDIVGDARDALDRLVASVGDYHSDGVSRVRDVRRNQLFFNRPYTSTAGKLSGRDVVRAVSEIAPDEVVVTGDAGENRLFLLRDFQAKAGGDVLQPNGGGGMGYAIPAAMSAALNRLETRAIAVCGDGGYSMTLTALLSAVELGLTLTVVVLDNHVLGWVHSGQRGRIIASTLKEFDYAGIATAMGAVGISVDDIEDFRTAFTDSLSRSGVTVIVARTTTEDRYQQLMSSLNQTDVYAVLGDD